jgi:hypothetical protein
MIRYEFYYKQSKTQNNWLPTNKSFYEYSVVICTDADNFGLKNNKKIEPQKLGFYSKSKIKFNLSNQLVKCFVENITF